MKPLTLSLPQEIIDFLQQKAEERFTSKSKVVVEYVLSDPQYASTAGNQAGTGTTGTQTHL